MHLAPGVEAIDLAIYLPEHETLVISDPHIGFEESLNAQGILVPRTHYKDLVDRLELIFADIKKRRQSVHQVVINGDIKHEFGGIRRQEWKDITRIVDYLLRRVEKLVLIKGNHDVQLGPITTRRGVVLVNDVRLHDILIVHGDREPDDLKGVTTIIMGHEHPAIGLRSGSRVERFKCYLVGKYKRKTLIVQPSANLLTEGSDMMKEQTLSPLLSKGVLEFKAFVLDEKKRKLLDFGTLKRLL